MHADVYSTIHTDVYSSLHTPEYSIVLAGGYNTAHLYLCSNTGHADVILNRA